MLGGNPKTLWRVVTTANNGRGWEPPSRTYAQRGWALRRARACRFSGVTVEIFKAELTWTKVEDE